MKSITSKLLPVCLIFIIICTLLNSKAFGASTLISYFSFCCLAGFLAIIVFFKGLLRRPDIGRLPSYLGIFFLLAIYIQVHGIVSDEMGLTHYYWLASICLIFSVHFWIASSLAGKVGPRFSEVYNHRVSFLLKS